MAEFDKQTHHYNKEGKVIRTTPYRMTVDAVKGKRFERPPGSGMWYAEDGTLLADESADVKRLAAMKEEEAKVLAEAQEKAAREKLREEIRQELLAEQKAQGQKAHHGTHSKA